MKFFAVFSAVVALATSSYLPVSTWTLDEIQLALHDPATDPALVPHLIDGLDTIMANLIAGDQQTTVTLSVPLEQTVTLAELTAAIHDQETNPAVLPYLEDALNDLMFALYNGQKEDSIVLSIPAMTMTQWNLQQLSMAVQDPATDPELMVYLEYAMNQLMADIYAGSQVNAIMVVTPPGVIVDVPQVPQEAISPPVSVLPPQQPPIAIQPELPVVPETPVIPAAVVPAVSSSPLVQLIVNINAKAQEPAAAVTPVVVRPLPVVTPEESEPTGPVLAVGPWA